APTDSPSNTVPSSRTRIAGWVMSFALRWGSPACRRRPEPGCKKPRTRRLSGPGLSQQASRNCTGGGVKRERRGGTRVMVSAFTEQQAAHRVQPGRAAGQARGRVQRATGEDVAVGGAVHQLQALALPGQLHQVLADDVAGTQAGVAR